MKNLTLHLLTGVAMSMALAAMPAAGFTQPAPASEPAAAMAEVPAVRGDEMLRRVLVYTYHNNPRLQAQREELASVDEQMPQALSGFLPSAIFDYNKGEQHTALNADDYEHSDTGLRRLTVTQPLFRGGRTVYGISRARHLVKASRGDLLAMEQQVLLDAVTAYMNVVRDRAVLELSRNNVDVLDKQLQASRDRFDVGEVTRTDVAQSEARLSRARSDATQAEGQLSVSRANFEQVVGLPAEGLPVPESFPETPATLEAALATGLKFNPNIMSAYHRQRSASKEVNINIGTLLPEVSLQGTTSQQEGLGFAGNADFNEEQVILNARIPLYQSGAEYSRVRETQAIASQRQFELTQAQNQVREAVTQAWENLQTSIATIRSNQDGIRAADIALEGVRQEHLYGARTVLDVLDAEQELFIARVNLVRSERDRAVSLFNLLASAGKLTIADLGYETPIYDPRRHYEDVKYQFIGF